MSRREQGFALFIVIALLALMAALVADFATLAQTDVRATRNMVERERARMLAEAGYTIAVAKLLDPVAGRALATDGSRRDVSLDGGVITLAIQDEAGKIDLNWAPMELISGMLDALGVPGDVEARILDAVADRRAGVLLPPYAPGDIAASALLGGPTLKKLALMPFDSVGELQSLAKIDQSSFERIAPSLTVYSESRRINLYAASRPVLMAIPGVTAEMADAIVARAMGLLAAHPARWRSSSVEVAAMRPRAAFARQPSPPMPSPTAACTSRAAPSYRSRACRWRRSACSTGARGANEGRHCLSGPAASL